MKIHISTFKLLWHVTCLTNLMEQVVLKVDQTGVVWCGQKKLTFIFFWTLLNFLNSIFEPIWHLKHAKLTYKKQVIMQYIFQHKNVKSWIWYYTWNVINQLCTENPAIRATWFGLGLETSRILKIYVYYVFETLWFT